MERFLRNKAVTIFLWFCAIGLSLPLNLWYPGRRKVEYYTLSELKGFMEELWIKAFRSKD